MGSRAQARRATKFLDRVNTLARNAGMTHDQLKIVTIAALDAEVALDDRDEQRLKELEAAGFRLVNGGQTDAYDDQGMAPWRIYDHRTGETLAEGRGRPVDMDELWQDDWYHVDRVLDELDVPPLEIDGFDPDAVQTVREEVTRPALAPLYRRWATS